MVELREQRNRIDAEFCRLLAGFDPAVDAAGDGATSVMSWLRSRLRLSRGEASDLVHAARLWDRLPCTTSALRAGAVSLVQAGVQQPGSPRALENRPPPVESGPAQPAVRVDRDGPPDDLEQRQVAEAVGVRDRG